MSPSSSHQSAYAHSTESRGHKVVGTAVAFMTLGMILTLLRIWARRLQAKSFMIGDVLVPATLVLLWALCIVAIYVVQICGFGHHTHHIITHYGDTLHTNNVLVYYVLPCLHYVSVALPRLTILNLYLSFLRQNWARHCCYALGVLVIVGTLINLSVTVFQCWPIGSIWGPGRPPLWCMNLQIHLQWGNFANIFIDTVILALPVPMVLRLSIPTREKVALLFTLSIASIGFAAGIIRFAIIIRQPTPCTDWPAHDHLWQLIDVTMCSIVETGMVLMAVCLITLRPLLKGAVAWYESLHYPRWLPSRVDRRSTPASRRAAVPESFCCSDTTTDRDTLATKHSHSTSDSHAHLHGGAKWPVAIAMRGVDRASASSDEDAVSYKHAANPTVMV